MNLSMTIGAEEYTLFNLFSDLLPAPSVSFRRNPKILGDFIRMVKLKSLRALVIPTKYTSITFEGQCFLADILPALLYHRFQVVTPISIFPRITTHAELTAACSTIELSRNLQHPHPLNLCHILPIVQHGGYFQDTASRGKCQFQKYDIRTKK